MSLLSDVNLDEISFGKDGKSIELSFIDVYEGGSLGTLKCSSVYSFNYQNCFDEDDSLAVYVGEVNCKIIEKKEAPEFLKRSGYSFSCNDLFAQNKLLVINVEGGEITLEIMCGAASYNGEKLK